MHFKIGDKYPWGAEGTKIPYSVPSNGDFIGEGYGIPTPEALEAIATLARSEAILLDPCYTSKAMAGMIRHIRDGAVGSDETVVFLHTGGMPALFTDSFVAAFEGIDRPPA